MADLSVLVLAAGKGTRMKSATAKVLHTVGGRPLIDHVLGTVSSLKPASVCVIVGHQGDEVQAHVKAGHPKTAFARQRVLDGSGGAVRQALSWLKKQRGHVFVTCGDAPLISAVSYRALLSTHRSEKNAATVLTARMADPAGYGRIRRGFDGAVLGIVEHLDATPEERSIDEINTGTYCFDARALASVLPKLSNKNAKKEYYLTDTLSLLRDKGGRIGGVVCPDADETLGINSRADQAQGGGFLRRRKIGELMAAGVTVVDPAATYVAESVSVGPDTVLWPGTFLLGETKIGSGCRIGPWAHVEDTIIENDVIFLSSFAEKSVIRSGARVGPYSRVRPKSDIGRNAHLGNFSETKNTVLEEGAKANHLSYLGDAKIGKHANIGAGTITCNYDGINKFPTEIHDHAFIGSNTNLVAPVTIGAHAVIGAGSTVTDDVPAWALAVERSKTIVRNDWAKRRAKKGSK